MKPDNQAEVIHSSESQLRQPLTFILLMFRDLFTARTLAWHLMIRDLSAQYRQSVFGILWAFIPPIVMAVGFTFAGQAKIINVGDTGIPYPAYVMFSTALWQTFTEALNGPLQAVTQSKQLLARILFPREAILLSKLGEVGFNFLVKLILIIGVFAWYKIPITSGIFLAPVALLMLILLGTFLGILICPIGMLYQDISRGLTLVTGLWLFLTPVVYPMPSMGTFSTLVKLNPVTPLLVGTRELATIGTVSDPVSLFTVAGITIVGLFLTWILFRLSMPHVIERLSS